MLGFITEDNLDQAEKEFPGIRELYARLPSKPRTFLDLVAELDHWHDTSEHPLVPSRR